MILRFTKASLMLVIVIKFKRLLAKLRIGVRNGDSHYHLRRPRSSEKSAKLLYEKTNDQEIRLAYSEIPNSVERNIKFSLETLAMKRKKFDLILFKKVIPGRCGLEPIFSCTVQKSITGGNTTS
ncbi:hypothetical protein Y032_0073g754 [Ancylostoma ceylanicum]|uniref:Uncharacterized protein n=1 Tax=Ancylostoma ceylanicum TaxID=53326 RepID=A0A016TVP7_9BILA|nr:hypothetical protein Y032_0073g754 [Ancylostoma ceylanicum]